MTRSRINKQRVLSSALMLAILGGLLVWTFSKMNLNTLKEQFLEIAKKGSVAQLIFWALLYPTIQGLRFFRVFPAGISPLKHIGLNFANHTGNILLPARLGEFVRPFYMKSWKPQLAVKKLVGWTVIEKIGEGLSMFVLIALAYALYPLHLPNTWVLMSIVVVGFAAVFVIPQSSSKGAGIAWGLGLSFVAWILSLLSMNALLQNMELSLLLMIMITLVSSVPLAPGGLGLTQWASVLMSSRLGITQEQALIYSSIFQLLWILTRLSVGVPMLMIWGWPSKNDLNKMRQKLPEKAI